ncbi:MAG: hypothetical protein ACOC30_00955 [Marinilabilia sp.]
MKIIDLQSTSARPYEQRDKNVLYRGDHFKTRIIELAEGEKLPPVNPVKWHRMLFFTLFWAASG